MAGLRFSYVRKLVLASVGRNECANYKTNINMKKILIVAFVTVCYLSANAQDVLVRKGGEVENVKVLEVSPTEVKYKKSNNEDGPIFIEKRSNIY